MIKNYKYIYIMNNTLYDISEIFNNKNFKNITSLPGYNFSNYNDNIKTNLYINSYNNNIINDSFYFKININKNLKFNKTRKKK